MKYRVISSPSITDLEKTVNRALDDGWITSGGVTIDHGYYYQALTLSVFAEFMVSQDTKNTNAKEYE